MSCLLWECLHEGVVMCLGCRSQIKLVQGGMHAEWRRRGKCAAWASASKVGAGDQQKCPVEP